MPEYVTHNELSAHLEPMREDIQEIKGDVKELLGNRWLGPRAHNAWSDLVPLLIVTVVTTALSVALGLLIH